MIDLRSGWGRKGKLVIQKEGDGSDMKTGMVVIWKEGDGIATEGRG